MPNPCGLACTAEGGVPPVRIRLNALVSVYMKISAAYCFTSFLDYVSCCGSAPFYFIGGRCQTLFIGARSMGVAIPDVVGVPNHPVGSFWAVSHSFETW